MSDDAQMSATFDVSGLLQSFRKVSAGWQKSVRAQKQASTRLVGTWARLGAVVKASGAKMIATARAIGVAMGRSLARGISSAARLVSSALNRLGNFVARWARRLAYVFGGVGVAFIANAIRVRSGVEETLAAVRGVTGEALNVLRGTMVDIGTMPNVVFSLNEVADSMYSLGSLGVSSAKAMKDMMAAAMPMAAGMRTDVDSAIQSVLATLRTFNLESDQSTRIADVMVKAQNTSAATFERLRESMVYASPAFSAVNQSIETMVASLTRFYNAGIPASMAGAALQTILARLEQPPREAQKAIRALSLSLSELKPSANDFIDILLKLKKAQISQGQALQMFGIRQGMRAYTLIRATTPELKKYRDELNESGAASKLAAQQLDNLRGDVRKLWREFGVLNFEVGGLFQRGFRQLVQGITEFIKNVRLAVKESVLLQAIAELVNDALANLGKAFKDIDATALVKSFAEWTMRMVRGVQGVFLALKALFSAQGLGIAIAQAIREWGKNITAAFEIAAKVLYNTLLAAWHAGVIILRGIVMPVAKQFAGVLVQHFGMGLKEVPGLSGVGERIAGMGRGWMDAPIGFLEPKTEGGKTPFAEHVGGLFGAFQGIFDAYADGFSKIGDSVKEIIRKTAPQAYELLFNYDPSRDAALQGKIKVVQERIAKIQAELAKAAERGNRKGVEAAKEAIAREAQALFDPKGYKKAKEGVVGAAEKYLQSRRRIREIGEELRGRGLSRQQRSELMFEAHIERTKMNLARQEGRQAMAVVRAMQQAAKQRDQQARIAATIARNTAATATAVQDAANVARGIGLVFRGGGMAESAGPLGIREEGQPRGVVGGLAQGRDFSGRMRSPQEIMEGITRRRQRGTGGGEQPGVGVETPAALAVFAEMFERFVWAVNVSDARTMRTVQRLQSIVETALARRTAQDAAGVAAAS